MFLADLYYICAYPVVSAQILELQSKINNQSNCNTKTIDYYLLIVFLRISEKLSEHYNEMSAWTIAKLALEDVSHSQLLQELIPDLIGIAPITCNLNTDGNLSAIMETLDQHNLGPADVSWLKYPFYYHLQRHSKQTNIQLEPQLMLEASLNNYSDWILKSQTHKSRKINQMVGARYNLSLYITIITFVSLKMSYDILIHQAGQIQGSFNKLISNYKTNEDTPTLMEPALFGELMYIMLSSFKIISNELFKVTPVSNNIALNILTQCLNDWQFIKALIAEGMARILFAFDVPGLWSNIGQSD